MYCYTIDVKNGIRIENGFHCYAANVELNERDIIVIDDTRLFLFKKKYGNQFAAYEVGNWVSVIEKETP